jgi:aspartokinase
MKTVHDVLQRLVIASPLLEEGLASGIINLSALARQLRPKVNEILLRDVSEAALVMALRRLVPELQRSTGDMAQTKKMIRDLTVRSNLSEFTFQRSETLLEKQAMLLAEVGSRPDLFVTFAQGAVEMTTIVDGELASIVEGAFANERCLKRLDSLAAVSVRLAPENVETPGVYYSILKQLAFNGINVIEVVSTTTEIIILLEQNLVDRAFSILLRAATKD